MVKRKIAVTLITFLLVLSLQVFASAESTVEFWTYGGGRVEDPMVEIIEMFEEENPDINIDMQVFPEWADLHQQALMAIAADSEPDAAVVKPLNVADLVVRGAVKPLDNYFKEDKEIDPSMFLDVLVEESGSYQGKMYIIPNMASCPALYYNKDLFDEAGLAAPKEITWDEMIELGKKLTRPEKGQHGYYWYGNVNTFFMALWGNNGEYLSPDNETIRFNSPEGQEALQMLVDLQHKHKIMPSVGEQEDQHMYQNRVGMWPHAMSRLGAYPREAPDLNFGIEVLPEIDKRTSIEMSNGALIFDNAPNPEDAWKFLKFLTTDERAIKIHADATGYAPAKKSELDVEPYTTDSKLKPFRWQLLNDLKARPVIPHAWELMGDVGDEIDQAMFKNKTPAEALEDAERKAKEILADIEEEFLK